jgi:hydroxypyruvate isomerase
MARFSVCVEMIYKPLPFAERLAAVKRSGYSAYEFWGWQNKDMPEIVEQTHELGLEVAAFGAAGGTLVDPANHQRYWDAFAQAGEWARQLRCPSLIVTTGNALPGVPRAQQLDDLARGLAGVARAAEQAGVVAVLEPLNTKVNHPGYFLDHSADAFALVDRIGSPHLRVLFDIYHMQVMEGDIIQTIQDHLPSIGHFHVADVPGRHEPGTGELNYSNVFRRLDAAGYRGYVGLEFHPSADHAQALEVVKALAA